MIGQTPTDFLVIWAWIIAAGVARFDLDHSWQKLKLCLKTPKTAATDNSLLHVSIAFCHVLALSDYWNSRRNVSHKCVTAVSQESCRTVCRSRPAKFSSKTVVSFLVLIPIKTRPTGISGK